MSPYGKIATPLGRSSAPLPVRTFQLPRASTSMTVFPLRADTAPPALVQYLHVVFNAVVEEGRTYPQLDLLSLDEFAAYFFADDCFVGILEERFDSTDLVAQDDGSFVREGLVMASVVADRSWEACVLGFYYVKPNYPGRSAHICNGGFVVPRGQRGLRVGRHLGLSYLKNAPLLASVFNLVYVSNVASCKIWDGLGFTKIGIVPSAGRLKGLAGAGDEFVDAAVYYKLFSRSCLLITQLERGSGSDAEHPSEAFDRGVGFLRGKVKLSLIAH